MNKRFYSVRFFAVCFICLMYAPLLLAQEKQESPGPADIQALKDELAKSQKDLQASQELSHQLIQEKEYLQGQQKQLSFEVKNLHNQRLTLEKENRALAEAGSQTQENQALVEKLKTLEDKVAQVQSLQEDYEKLSKENEKLNKSLEDSRKRLESAQEELAKIRQTGSGSEELATKIGDLDKQNQKLSDSLQQVLQDLSNSEDNKARLKESIEKISGELSETKKAYQSLAGEYDNLKKEKQDLSDQFSQLKTEKSSLGQDKESELLSLKDRVSQLEKELKNSQELSGALTHENTVFQSKQNDFAKQIKGLESEKLSLKDSLRVITKKGAHVPIHEER